MRLLTYALMLLGLLASLGVLYFRHEIYAAEQSLRQDTSWARAQNTAHPT